MPTYHACAKINWALNITGRRADGYHLLDMLMQTIDLRDALTIEPAEELRLTVNGAPALRAAFSEARLAPLALFQLV